MAKAASLACLDCQAPLAPVPLAGGMRVAWGHASEPEDGHHAAVPVLKVTYRRAGAYWDAEAEEVPGLPARGFLSLDAARSCAWTLLRKVVPPRPVAEHVTGEGESLQNYAAGWNVKGGTTLV
jgi:hypothetical protein